MTGRPVTTPPVVLLLPDVPILRMVLAGYIDEADCTVLEAASTAEAIRLLETRPEIRVVVTELDVRGSLKGVELAAVIRKRWPPVELILIGALRPRPETIPAAGRVFRQAFAAGAHDRDRPPVLRHVAF